MIVNYATDQDGGKKYRKNFDAIDWHNLDSPAQVEPQAVSGVVAPVGSGAIPKLTPKIMNDLLAESAEHLNPREVDELAAEELTTLAETGRQDVRKSLHQIYNETVNKQTNKEIQT